MKDESYKREGWSHDQHKFKKERGKSRDRGTDGKGTRDASSPLLCVCAGVYGTFDVGAEHLVFADPQALLFRDAAVGHAR